MVDKVHITTVLCHFHNNLWSYYLPIEKTIGDQFIEGDNRRIICHIGSGITIRGALMPKEDIYTIYVTNKIQKQLGIGEGDEVKIDLEKDRSEYGMEMPESFEVLLSQDEEGRKYFEELTKGKQRTLIYIVSKVKSVDSQLAKGLAIMHHLREAEGKLDFKRLNVLIKEYNSRK